MTLRRENDDLRDRLRDLSEQLMLQDLSNDMESFILDKSFSQIGTFSQFGSRISHMNSQSIKMSSPTRSRQNWKAMRSHTDFDKKEPRDMSADIVNSKRNSQRQKPVIRDDYQMPLKRKSALKTVKKIKKPDSVSIHKSGSGDSNLVKPVKHNGLNLKFINSGRSRQCWIYGFVFMRILRVVND